MNRDCRIGRPGRRYPAVESDHLPKDVGVPVHLRTKLTRTGLPHLYVHLYVEAPVPPGAEHVELDQVVPRFPTWFGAVRVRRARSNADPVAPYLDTVSVLVPEEMQTI